MKYKQKIDIIIALLLILLGSIILISPLFNVSNIRTISIIVFAAYTILNVLHYILTYKSKDIEGIISGLASLIALIASIFYKEFTPRILAMILMTWVIVMSIAKLNKADYYHDRRDRMWKVRIFILALFILTGILASVNLAYTSRVQIIVVGFFMLVHGILELFDPITKYLIAHS